MNDLEDILGLRESDWPDEFKKLRELVRSCEPEKIELPPVRLGEEPDDPILYAHGWGFNQAIAEYTENLRKTALLPHKPDIKKLKKLAKNIRKEGLV